MTHIAVSETMKIRTVLLLVSSVIGLCRGFPSGAPSSACGSMLPRHGYRTRPQDHSKNPSPYTITIEENYDTYTPGQKFECKYLKLSRYRSPFYIKSPYGYIPWWTLYIYLYLGYRPI